MTSKATITAIRHHPREGGGLVRAKRLYKCVLTDAGRTPAFAGVEYLAW